MMSFTIEWYGRELETYEGIGVGIEAWTWGGVAFAVLEGPIFAAPLAPPPPPPPLGPVGKVEEEGAGEAGAEECSKGGRGLGIGDRGTFWTLNGRPSAIAPLWIHILRLH